jgi:hypothetical protein
MIGGFATLWTYPELKTEMVGMMTIILMFYFGTSKGSERKTEILADSAKAAAEVAEKK